MKRIFTLALAVIFCQQLSAQLTVQNGFTATQLGNNLAGSNVTVTNATVTGTGLQYGTFQFNGSGFPLSSGVVLSTGNIYQCPGPNNNSGSGTSMGGPGHPLLTSIAGVQTYDAVEFKFDFEVQTDMIEFQYIFASEEYNEFVGSGFNDVFAFFISGPGITGQQNIALVPNTNVPVAINNINLGSYWQYFNDNTTGSTNIQFDGYTSVLTARKTGLIPCETYTLTLVIADAGDGILDAAVFLQESSLVQGTVSAQANTFSANNTALEGCIDASFTFMLDSAVAQNTVIPIGIGGSASNGIDYDFIDPVLIIPAGQTSVTMIIDAFADGIFEGQETVELYFSPAPCQPYDTVFLYIDDYQPLSFETTPNDLSCFQSNDGEISFNITGGSPPFSVQLTDSATGVMNTYTTLPITGLSTGTYYIRVLDGYGCWAEDIISGAIFDADTTFLPDGNGVSYESSIVLSGFGAGQTLQNVSQLQSVCMEMEHSFIGDLEIKLRAPNGTEIVLKQQPGGSKTNMGEPVAVGPNDPHSTDLTPGVGYDYCFLANPTYGTMVAESNNYTYTYVSTTGVTLTDKYLPAGSYTSYEPLTNLVGVPLNGLWTLIVTDDIPNNNGYIFNWSISISADQPDSVVTLAQPASPVVSATYVSPGCNLTNGSINITVTGTTGPYTFLWSNGAITEDLSGIGAGNYSVTVNGSDGCNTVKTFSLTNNGAVGITGIVVDQLCASTNSGSINISLSGGTSPFSFTWTNGATTEDLAGIAPGSYSVQVSDAAGCIGAKTFQVLAASQMTVTGVVINEDCGNHEGTIDISPLGGTGSYTYSWSNFSTQEDLSDLQQGAYIVTITDANGCTKSATFNVLNLVGNCIPVCDLEFVATAVTDEICGNGAGSITHTVFTTAMPYSVQWNTGQTSEDILGLHSGTYTVTVTDASMCEVVGIYTVENQTGSLSMTFVSVTNELCGNQNGGINISVAGGALPYSYHWSNGAVSQDVSSLIAGVYNVTIMDGNHCEVHETFTITNETGTLGLSYGNAMNASCGQNNGSIDIAVTGGSLPYTYHWSNNATSQDLHNIGPGTYTCTITDNHGCQLVSPGYVVGNQSGTLIFSYLDEDDEICNNNQGEIIAVVSGGVSPYNFAWSNGASTSTLSGLSEGTYYGTVTDATGCSISTGPIVVANTSGTLALTGINSGNEICGNNTGFVEVQLTGGTAPVSFLWNTGSVSQNLYNLESGTYTCQVTDASGCTFSTQAIVLDELGSLEIQNIVSLPEACGNQTGSLNLYIHGETPPVSYLWSNGALTQDIGSLSAGLYQVTVSDASGCSTTGQATVTNNSGSLAASVLSVTNEICGASNGSIDIGFSCGISPHAFLWSNGSTSEDLAGVHAGSYSLTITDNTGCSVSVSEVQINNNSGGLQVVGMVIPEVCNNNNGSVSLNTQGGSLPYTYLWTGGSSGISLVNLSEGTYLVTVTDASGCSIVESYYVPNSSGSLSLGTLSVSHEVCGNNAGAISTSPTGGLLPYLYNWSNGATTATLTGLSEGNFGLTVTDASGCVVSGSVVVNNNPGAFQLDALVVTDESCSAGDGSLNVTLSGGDAPLSYLWSHGATTLNISGLSAGVYTCTATDDLGCVLVYSAIINSDPGNFLIDVTLVEDESCGQENGSINVEIGGGTAPYTYIWNNGSSTQDLTGLSADTYTLLALDNAGCSSSVDVVVADNGGSPSITSALSNNEMCNNDQGSISITVAGGQAPYNYDWEFGSQTPCCNYNLQINDQFGDGWDGAYLQVYLNGVMQGTYSTVGTGSQYSFSVCNTDSIRLRYVPGNFEYEHSYSLFGPGGIVFSDGPTPLPGNAYSAPVNCQGTLSGGSSISGLTSGNYEVTVTDVNGCSVTSQFIIEDDPGTMALSVNNVINDYCSNAAGSIDIALAGGHGPFVYSWSNGAVSQDVAGLLSGNYTVTIQDNWGCQIIQTIEVEGPTNALGLASVISINAYCGGSNGSLDISPAGGFAPFVFHWSNGATVEDLSAIPAGTYLLTVTDSYNCTFDTSLTVGNLTNGLAVNPITTNPVCTNNAGSVDLTISGGTGPYTFNWSNGATTEDISGLAGGIYLYTVTDATSCNDFGQVVLTTISGNVGISSSFVQNEFCDGTDGYILITPSGGTPPLSYNWTNGAITEDIYNLEAGYYTVVISDVNGCTFANAYEVENDGSFIVSDTAIVNASCSTCPDGSVNLTLAFPGGSPGSMEFAWSNGATTEDISGLTAGSYTVTITNTDYSCVIVETYLVDFTSAITEQQHSQMLTVFPNPASDLFNADFSVVGIAQSELCLFDPEGRLLLCEEMTGVNAGRFTIDLTEFADGIYLVRFTSGTYTVFKRIVKHSNVE